MQSITNYVFSLFLLLTIIILFYTKIKLFKCNIQQTFVCISFSLTTVLIFFFFFFLSPSGYYKTNILETELAQRINWYIYIIDIIYILNQVDKKYLKHDVKILIFHCSHWTLNCELISAGKLVFLKHALSRYCFSKVGNPSSVSSQL